MSKYTVEAYLCTNYAGLMADLETNDFSEVEDFIWTNCQYGYNCELINNKTGEIRLYYADAFTEETNEVSKLLADLALEQQCLV